MKDHLHLHQYSVRWKNRLTTVFLFALTSSINNVDIKSVPVQFSLGFMLWSRIQYARRNYLLETDIRTSCMHGEKTAGNPRMSLSQYDNQTRTKTLNKHSHKGSWPFVIYFIHHQHSYYIMGQNSPITILWNTPISDNLLCIYFAYYNKMPI